MQDEMKEAMTWLGKQPRTLFVGQGVACGGTRQSASFDGVPVEKRIEFPVAEEMQLGASVGLSLEGYKVVSVFPRWNFLLLAANQLVNHLDRLPLYSDYRPKVIVRVAVGHSKPLDPGLQHQDDFTDAFAGMLRTVKVVRLEPGQALNAYKQACDLEGSFVLVDPPCC